MEKVIVSNSIEAVLRILKEVGALELFAHRTE